MSFTLSDDSRRTVLEAATLLERDAATIALHHRHFGQWPDAVWQSRYDDNLRVADDLRMFADGSPSAGSSISLNDPRLEG